MRFQVILVGLSAVLASPAQAASPPNISNLEQPQTASIPFSPPLDKPFRYRWEKSVQKDGKSRTGWNISEYRFTRDGEGYLLQVTPISSGASETDPVLLAAYKRLEQLISRPVVLQLAADGTIEGVRDENLYWSAIISVLRDTLKAGAGKKADDEAFRTAVNGVVQLFETMPAEARLALLTESVQPLVEFAETETTVGEPLTASVETTSPFGGSLKQDVNIRLERVGDGRAHLVIGSSVPRLELQKLATSLLSKVLPDKRKEIATGLASLQTYRHDTVANFVISVSDGMLESYSSEETVAVEDKGKISRRVTKRKLVQVR